MGKVLDLEAGIGWLPEKLKQGDGIRERGPWRLDTVCRGPLFCAR